MTLEDLQMCLERRSAQLTVRYQMGRWWAHLLTSEGIEAYGFGPDMEAAIGWAFIRLNAVLASHETLA